MPAPGPTPRTVLVIDDDEVMRELLSAILAADGYTVHTASSGEAALAWMQHNSPHIILTDLHMPGLQGAELAGQLKAVRPPGGVLIGMSGSDPQESERLLFESFLLKPFGLKAFAHAVEGAQGHAPAQLPRSHTSGHSSAEALDESIYARLAAMLPAAQLQELYRISIDDVLRRVERMKTATAAGDLDECRREAHAIKGGCGMVGATELSALAARIERGSSADTPPLSDFAVACSRLQRILDARL